jgi:hypothetical protein
VPQFGHTARAARISRYAMKSRCACEWGAWGRVSDDGPGHYNPDRSEDPWGRAANAARTVVHPAHRVPGLSTGILRYRKLGCTKGGCKLYDAINSSFRQEGPTDIPALKPYWGKPAVRNFRGDHGDVGIIQSPVRAMALPGSGSGCDSPGRLGVMSNHDPYSDSTRAFMVGLAPPSLLGSGSRHCYGINFT